MSDAESLSSIESDSEDIGVNEAVTQKNALLEDHPEKDEEEGERLAIERETREQLLTAARSGELEEVKEILRYASEENLDVIDSRVEHLPGCCPGDHMSGYSPLMIACRLGHLEVVKVLKANGANMELFDMNEKFTALMCASYYNQPDIVELLRDCDHSYQDAVGRTPLIVAAIQGHLKVVELLLWESDVDFVDITGSSALVHAVKGGQLRIAKLLCDYSADVDKTDRLCRTALHHASRWGFYGCVKLLLERGADVDTRDRKGWTPLMRACRYNHLECVRLIITKNPLRNIREKSEGRTALMLAAMYTNNTGMISLLLLEDPEKEDSDERIDVLVKDIYGIQALQMASSVGVQALIRDIIELLPNVED